MRGQLWWATLDGSSRPWLIVQADALNDTAPTVVALPVTLAPQDAGWPLTIELPARATGLPRPTWVRVTLPRALPRHSLDKPIGTLPEREMSNLDGALAAVLDLSRAAPAAALP